MKHSRHRPQNRTLRAKRWAASATVIAVTGMLAAPSSAGVVPVIAMSPPSGGSHTTFTLRLPASVVRRAGRSGLYVNPVEPKGAPRAHCSVYELPQPKFSGRGRNRTARFVLQAKNVGRPEATVPKSGWCRGTYTVVAYTETIIDDNDKTGAGGSVEQNLARSSFRVR